MEAIAERLQWWAELFEPPCVGFAASREEAGEFAAAGADFVLVGDFIWADPRGAEAALTDAEQAITASARSRVRKSQSRDRDSAGMKLLRPISIARELPDDDGRRHPRRSR